MCFLTWDSMRRSGPKLSTSRSRTPAFVFLPLHGAGAIDAFDQDLEVAVRQLQGLHDVGDTAHRVDVVRPRIVD